MGSEDAILNIIGAIVFFLFMQWLYRNFFLLFGRKKSPDYAKQNTKISSSNNEFEQKDDTNSVAPVPPDIARSIDTYKNWDFGGQELSPLTCFGYRVGKSQGRPEKVRREILSFALGCEIPSFFPSSYILDWGKPKSRKRYQRILSHIRGQADSRAGSFRDYSVAISEWRSDANWFEKEFFLPNRK